MFRQILLLTALTTYLTISSAQSLPESQWQFHMSSQMGTVDAVVTLKAEAGLLTGQFDLGNGRTWPIEEGTIEGSSINFKINRDGASMTYVMTATLEGDTAEGIASAWGSNVPWTMTRDSLSGTAGNNSPAESTRINTRNSRSSPVLVRR